MVFAAKVTGLNAAVRRVSGAIEVHMAYVLLAVGALMSLAGAVAAINGYSIIQVEQGWSSVIAGATLFAGGIVTIGLALVTRALTQLQAALPRAATEAAATTDLREPAFVPPPAEPAKAEPTPAETYVAPLTETPEAGAAETVEAYAAHHMSTMSTHENFATAPEVPEPVRAPTLPSAASPSLSDDWFDRAFAELDEAVPEGAAGLRGRSEPKATTPSPFSRRREPAPEPVRETVREPAYAAAEAAPAPAPEASEPAPSSAIIGRYEADETSYIMYADGSIEAQTHSGVYRFASMAELKAFIES